MLLELSTGAKVQQIGGRWMEGKRRVGRCGCTIGVGAMKAKRVGVGGDLVGGANTGGLGQKKSGEKGGFLLEVWMDKIGLTRKRRAMGTTEQFFHFQRLHKLFGVMRGSQQKMLLTHGLRD